MGYWLILSVIVLAVAIGYYIGATKRGMKSEKFKKTIGISGIIAIFVLITKFSPNFLSYLITFFPALLRLIEEKIKKKVLFNLKEEFIIMKQIKA